MNSIQKSALLITLLSALSLLTILQLSPGAVRANDPTYSVTIIDYAFQPLHINITTGTTVTWTYTTGNTIHTVTSDPGTNQTLNPPLSSGDLSRGQSFSYTFDLPGYYPYQCAVHPNVAAMNGWVKVTGNPITTNSPSSNLSNTTLILLSGVAVGAVAVVLIAWLVLRRRHHVKT